jgi:hypothetical protein
MKDGVVLFLICVVTVGLIALGVMYVDGFHPSRASIAPSEVREGPAVVVPAPKPKVAPKPVKAAVPEPPAIETVAAAPPAPGRPAATSASATPAERGPAPPFPSVGEIALGAHEDNITQTFGDPALSALSSDRGHVLETLIYAKDGGKAVTVISLEDGKVSSAYSRPRPEVKAPIGQRRRGG